MDWLTFGSILLTIIILDILWLGVISKGLYQKELKNFLRPSFSIMGALLAYLLLAGGIYFFVISHQLANSLLDTAMIGAFFGLVVYGIYEFTNISLINGWPLKIVIVDGVWGVILCSLASLVGRLVLNP